MGCLCSRVILEKRAASGDIHPEAQIFTVKKVTAFVQPITLQILHSQIELGGAALQPGGDHLHADAIGDTALLDRLELLGQCGRERVENGINRFCARCRSAAAQTETDCQCGGQRPAQDLFAGGHRDFGCQPCFHGSGHLYTLPGRTERIEIHHGINSFR